MNYNLEKFKNGLQQLHIALSEKQMEQFLQYYELLVEKNKVMNLTAITEFDEVVEKHFLDSVSLTKQMDLHQPLKVLDLGTGAGFPGIPLKIVFPELEITLMDSLNKRVLFLQDVISSLQLENIEAVHGRAEEAARNKKYRESFDLCVSRAVANISTLSEYCLPFVKIGGSFISYKSSTIEDELEDGKKGIAILGGKVKDVYKFTLPDSELQRSFVIIEKEKKTPKAYPRKAGTPSKEPLH
ncbi:MAG: 16S rRNA (guanine(527)-N(7))-methyltransferase RsmG [Lachnospiraceae bacterium]|nr:16S rRNA (guanine(527)-N(7))-methyltransferase RsmG [Lachnospiraceae bacterium]